MKNRFAVEQYDVVHANQPHGYLAARALRSLRASSVFIHRSHGLESRAERDLKPWREKYGRDKRPPLKRLASEIVARALARNSHSIARIADGHIVSNTACRDFLHQELRVPIDRIRVIPLAPTRSFLEDDPQPMSQARLNRVLYVSQFAFFKAPMIVAQVINSLSSHVGLEFTWVCSKEHHPKIGALLKGNAKDLVRLLDWMPQERLMHLYDSHGIFLFPSFFEGFGKVFLEAMSRGLCVIAADNSGAHDVVTHEVDGILTATGDAQAMAETCLRLIGNPDRATNLSRSAIETARRYSWDRAAKETVAFFENRIEAKLRTLSI